MVRSTQAVGEPGLDGLGPLRWAAGTLTHSRQKCSILQQAMQKPLCLEDAATTKGAYQRFPKCINTRLAGGLGWWLGLRERLLEKLSADRPIGDVYSQFKDGKGGSTKSTCTDVARPGKTRILANATG